MKWEFVENKIKQDKSRGVYFIRTNHDTTSESKLWDVYNTIREVEATFRGLKTDLNIRPVHHQNDDRIDAHMYLTILAYQLVNTIRHMLKNNGINHGWKKHCAHHVNTKNTNNTDTHRQKKSSTSANHPSQSMKFNKFTAQLDVKTHKNQLKNM
jgi:transposase